jgi:hypothetical protein
MPLSEVRLNAKSLALIVMFAACYAISSFWTLFPIIGEKGRFISVASILAPLIGMSAGPFLGVAAIAIGALIALFNGSYSVISVAAGVASAFCCGMLYRRRRIECILFYACLLLFFALYPVYGPAWRFPLFLWLHLVGLIVLVSPLTSISIDCLQRTDVSLRNTFGILVITFVSLLTGHLAGSLAYEVQLSLFAPVEKAAQSIWATLTFVYPVERFIMWVAATFIGVPLHAALRELGFL